MPEPQGQRGYIAVEWREGDFQAIRNSTRGIVVVEAAGNGAENLDDPVYARRPAGFPRRDQPLQPRQPVVRPMYGGRWLALPTDPRLRARAPTARLDFSNWGSVVDVQGWGREVTTTGGRKDQAGDLQGGTDEDERYTDRFSGTSSATPIVTGVPRLHPRRPSGPTDGSS